MAMEHDDIMANVRAVHDELERRRRGGNMDTPVFLVIEELNRLMRDKSIADELSSFCEEMGQEARGYNIFAILCAQRATGLAKIRHSVARFICHKVSPMESSKIIPARYAKHSGELGVGQTFVVDGDGTVVPLQQVLIEEQEVAAAVQGFQKVMPNRQTEPVVPSHRHISAAPPLPQGKLVLRSTHLAHAVPTVRPSTSKSPASATWGEPPLAPKSIAQPFSPQPSTQSTQLPLHEAATEELVPRVTDPFDTLAALRNQHHKRKS